MKDKLNAEEQVFFDTLRNYLALFSEGQQPIVPLLQNEDGTIRRSATLDLPCYWNLPNREKLRAESKE